MFNRLLGFFLSVLVKLNPVRVPPDHDEFIDSEIYPSRPTFWQRLTGRDND